MTCRDIEGVGNEICTVELVAPTDGLVAECERSFVDMVRGIFFRRGREEGDCEKRDKKIELCSYSATVQKKSQAMTILLPSAENE
jgi:hypothetical protein